MGFFEIYHKLLKALVVLLFVSLTLVVTYQLFSRNVELLPRFSFTEELSRWIFIWVVFVGAAIGIRENSHFVIDFFSEKSKFNKYLDVLTILILGTISLLMLVMGIEFFKSGLLRVSPVSGLSLSYSYAAIPFAGLSMLIFTIEKILIFKRNSKEMTNHLEEVR